MTDGTRYVTVPVHGIQRPPQGDDQSHRKADGSDFAMTSLAYPARLEQAEDGITITFRDLPEAISAAYHPDEALHNAAEALSFTLEARLEEGHDIPPPSDAEPGEVMIAPSASVQAATLFRLARRGRTLSDIARAMNTSWAAVKRLEDPHHSPNLRQLERAAATLGKRLVLALEDNPLPPSTSSRRSATAGSTDPL